MYKRYTNHTLGPSMPQVAFTPLGLPSLATNHEKALKGWISDASPSGILKHLSIHTTTMIIP